MKAGTFAARLLHWFDRHGRHDLPWQHPRTPYRVWLSEVMLQQTRVATVVAYFERFVARFPDIATLAESTQDQVLACWSGLGYYSRARNLHAAAKQVVSQHGGMFPADVALLAGLPGIGRSTAAAIAAFAYDVIAPILDGNVKRVLARHAGIEGFPGAGPVEKVLWRHAGERLPAQRGDMVAYTQGLMDLGATICSRTDPTCLLCPVASDCAARISGRTADIPAARPSKVLPRRAQRYLLARHQDHVLLVKRPAPGIWGGLWCLPELADDDDAAAVARLHFGVTRTGEARKLAVIEHSFTHFHLSLHVTELLATKIEASANSPGTLWLAGNDLINAALPKPISRLLVD